MGIGWIFAILFALPALELLIWIPSMRSSRLEMADGLDEKFRTDTNTLISISSGDRVIRALAARLNVQLCALRKARLRLQNGDAALKNAIAKVSHDLRTPLTAICGYLDLLESQMAHEKQARYLATIHERTDAMRAMIDELLQYSMIESIEKTPKCEPVCLNAALEQSLVGFYGAFTAHGIVPDVRISEKRIMAKIDPDAIRRVLDNMPGKARNIRTAI